jgi:hypothetical protein
MRVQAAEPCTATVHHQRVVVGPTPPLCLEHRQQKARNVRSKEYAVFTCRVDKGNATSGNCIAPEEPGKIVSVITICGTSS